MTYRLQDSLGFRLSRTARIQERRLDQGLRQLGLTRITWCILLAAGNEGLTQPSEIAAFVGIDRTATSRALRQMQDSGIIERRTGRGDARTREIVVTAKGRDLIDQGTPLAEENNRIMAELLGPDNVVILKQKLDLLLVNAPALDRF